MVDILSDSPIGLLSEEQHRKAGLEVLLRSVVLRLGALMVLLLTVGNWSDVLHVLITFLGEAVCLLSSQDLVAALLKVRGVDRRDSLFPSVSVCTDFLAIPLFAMTICAVTAHNSVMFCCFVPHSDVQEEEDDKDVRPRNLNPRSRYSTKDGTPRTHLSDGSNTRT